MAEFNGRDIDRIVILTGAGVSAESGLATFRDSDGLWENHDPMEIATPEAFIGWLITFDDKAELIEPEELRARFVARVEGTI